MRTLAPLLALLVGLPDLAAAQDVTFDEAIALSQGTPGLEGVRRARDARARGDVGIGGASQGLSIEATPGARVRSQEDRGFEGQVGVVHSWSLGGLGRARHAAARAEREALGAELRREALVARLEAARRWIDLWRTIELERVLAEEVGLAERLVEITGRASRAGAGTRAAEAEAEAHAADATLRAVALEGLRHEASIALAIAMDRAPVETLRTRGEPPSPELPGDAERYVALAEGLPEVVAARLEAAAERARAAEIDAQHAPSLGLGVQAQRESPSGIVVQGVVGLAVPLRDPARRERSAALALAERREGEADRARAEAARTLALAFHEAEHARREEAATTERLVPALERLVAQREAALAAGEATVFELLDARRRLLAARARAIEARAARAWAEVRLWTLLAELEHAGAGGGEP